VNCSDCRRDRFTPDAFPVMCAVVGWGHQKKKKSVKKGLKKKNKKKQKKQKNLKKHKAKLKIY
jgi:hypothetical protein